MTLADKIREGMGLRREKGTIDKYSQIISKFEKATGKSAKWTKADLLKYFDNMISVDAAPAVIIQHFYALKRCFKILECEFSIDRDDLPRMGGKAQVRPVTGLDDIGLLIETTRKSGTDEERLYLAMATTYGLRREEMSRLVKASYYSKKDDPVIRVKVNTAKHGEEREHVVPEYLWVNAIMGGINSLPCGIWYLSRLWHDICDRAGYEGQARESWHSIRRALDTGLIQAGLNEPVIKNFMRWADTGSMVQRYFTGRDEQVDMQVFGVHPFLGYWQ